MRNVEARLRRAWARCLRRGRARVCRVMVLEKFWDSFGDGVCLEWDDGCEVVRVPFCSVGELLDWMRREGLLD